MIPIINGFFQNSFAFIRELPVLGDIFALLPSSIAQNDRMLFGVLLAGFATFYIAKNIMRYAATVAVNYFSERLLHHLRKTIFGRYLSFGKLFFDTTNVGHHSTLLIDFTRQAINPFLIIDRYINGLFSLMVYFVVMCMISWKFTLIALPLFITLHYTIRYCIVSIRARSHAIAERASALGKKTVEILSTIPLVKAYRTEQLEQRRYADISNQKAVLDFEMRAMQAFILPMQEVITMLFALAVFVGALWWFGRENIGTAPALLVYFYIVMNASSKFGVISGFRSILASAVGSMDAVLEIFDDEGKFFVHGGTEEFTGLKNDIAFRNLTFSYSADRTVLSDVSFAVKKGKMTAIVGPTGAGKSTLISLLMRYYDCPPASIFVDNKDLRSLTLDSYLKHTALVSQETLLFHDSLKNNIIYGLDNVSEKDLHSAVERARLADFVALLPQGLDTLIGDRGVRLSGGEKQRVSIARALLKGAEILILDEATSSLDSKTEGLIQEAINEAVHGRTAIVIAHRLSTIKNADNIVVITEGKVAEVGTLEELLARKSVFFALWEAQKF